jgi:hypothetical protein
MRTDLPILHKAILRILCYRHFFSHKELRDGIANSLSAYFVEDFGCNKEEINSDEARALQQIILEELFLAIQEEAVRISE